jgi:hypothetical protein
MPTHMKRARLRPRLTMGYRRNIFRTLARDAELRFFLQMSKRSLRVAGKYIETLMNGS